MRLIVCRLTFDSSEKPYVFKVPNNVTHLGAGRTLIASTTHNKNRKVNVISISDEFTIADENENALRFFCDPTRLETIIGAYEYSEMIWGDDE